jgi:hypothetical protein
MTKIAGSGSISQRHGSADPVPDPLQNVMDPQHWSQIRILKAKISENKRKIADFFSL